MEKGGRKEEVKDGERRKEVMSVVGRKEEGREEWCREKGGRKGGVRMEIGGRKRGVK